MWHSPRNALKPSVTVHACEGVSVTNAEDVAKRPTSSGDFTTEAIGDATSVDLTLRELQTTHVRTLMQNQRTVSDKTLTKSYRYCPKAGRGTRGSQKSKA